MSESEISDASLLEGHSFEGDEVDSSNKDGITEDNASGHPSVGVSNSTTQDGVSKILNPHIYIICIE